MSRSNKGRWRWVTYRRLIILQNKEVSANYKPKLDIQESMHNEKVHLEELMYIKLCSFL